MSDAAPVFKAIREACQADPTMVSLVVDRVGVIPLINPEVPYVGMALQTGPNKRFVDGHIGYSNLMIQVVAIGPASMRGTLYNIDKRLHALIHKKAFTNDRGTVYTMLREAEIDLTDPTPIAGDRYIRIGAIYLAIAKGA